MLSNKTQTEKSETFLLAHALLLFVLSLLVGVQGVFEIIDYMPHIISAGCVNCGAYAASIPSTLIMYLWFSVSVAVFYYRESRKMFTLIPYMCIIGIAPSLVYDLSFISENGFVSGGEYNVTLYLVMDIFLLLDSIVMIQLVRGTMSRKAAMICPAIYLITGLIYFSSVFVFYGSVERTNFMGYYFCNSVTNIVFSLSLFRFVDVLYPARKKEQKMENKYIALTFDDGPNTVTTPQVLEMLKKHNVTGSFFLVGDNINEESARIARECFEYGCEICNHSRTHSAMPQQTSEEIKAEIEYTNDKIKQITGGVAPKFFRPPYIALCDSMYDDIPLTFICGNGAEDWLDEISAEERSKRIIDQAQNGMIILLHDMEGNFRTVQALDTIIPELKRQGYTFVTVSDLFAKCNVTPRKRVIYSNVLTD